MIKSLKNGQAIDKPVSDSLSNLIYIITKNYAFHYAASPNC